MRTVNYHPLWENHPLRLTEAERKNLHRVLEDFFSNFHLQDIREILWEWLASALGSDADAYNSGFARSNLIFVYEQLELLIEAAYGIHRRQVKRQKWRNRKWHKKNAA